MGTINAVLLHEFGDASKLSYESMPAPKAGPGHVVVDIHACALNRLDIWVRNGLPNVNVEMPHVLGSDIAGKVRSVGAGVDEALVGKEVILNPGTSCGRCERCLSGWDNLCPRYAILGENTRGGYAEQIAVPVANLLDKPTRLSMIEAAALPLTFLTAWQMLVERAKLAAGETVLIHAVGSGVGSAGLQIAKLHGARVIGLASTQAKLDKAKKLGADATILSSEAGWHKQVRALPYVGRTGVDVVFEHVGQSTWKQSIKLCRSGGRVVTCGASSGWDAETDLRHVFFRQIQILGSTMGSKASLFRVLELVARQELKPVVDRVFALRDAAAAHEYLDRREQFGKVVLEVVSDG
jgi:NADPH:quinone reductase-like Zn-dependent oxidoreductase